MDNALAKINAIKEKIIFGGILVFIIYILVAIFACIADDGNTSGYSGSLATFSKFATSAPVIGVCILCLLDNLNKIINKNKVCQIFAIISLVAIPIFLILYLLNAWNLVESRECLLSSSAFSYSYSGCWYYGPNAFGKAIIFFGSIIALGTIGSLTMSIKTYNRRIIDTAKTVAAISYTVAVIIIDYLVLSNSYLSGDKTAASATYSMCFCLIAWISLTILAFYLSKFDNGVAPTPIRPLNAKIISASAPAVLTIEEVKDEKPETIYPEPTNVPIHHVDGVNLNVPVKEPKPEEKPDETPAPKPEKPETVMPEEHHDDAPLHASPGEPLFEEHPTIGPATSGTPHDVFDSLDSQENENKEVL